MMKSLCTQNAVEIPEYFEINDLKARLQDKDKTIYKLKDTIKSLRENTKEQNVNHDKCELEPINKELENSVAKLLSENKCLCNEINHVKQVFKDQLDLIKQIRVRHKEQSDSLINKLNLKSVENEEFKSSNLRQDTCPNAITPNTKKVAVSPMNNVKKVRSEGPETQYYTISLEACLKSTPDLSSNPKPSQRQEPGYGTVDLSIILNFGTLNKLAKDGLARGIPRLKFHKDHLCV
ncbi:hypothetical protein Tco_1321542 [Tanacetum coccineum]